MKKKVIVIGAGVSGLASAALLAKDGFDVTILEKNNEIGGRARVWKSEGFTFDMGPSWYMMPDEFERYFQLFGKKASSFYPLKKLKDRYTVIFSNGASYVVSTNLKQNIDLFEQVEKGAGKKLVEFLHQSRYLYNQAMRKLVFLDYRSLTPLLKPSLLTALFKLRLFQSFHSSVKEYFHSSDLQKIIEFTTVFLGGSPFNTPAFYTLIAHTDFNQGIWYPEGGMGEIVKALYTLATKQEVVIHTSEPVHQINIHDGSVCGIVTSKKTYPCDIVVTSCDYHHTDTALLSNTYRTYQNAEWKKKTLAPSAFLIYLGIKGKIKKLTHHVLYFDDSWEKHFQKVYDKPEWPTHPSYYIHCPTKTDPSLAPEGCESIMLLVPVAPGLKDSPEIRSAFSEKIIAHFETLIGEKLSKRIITKRIFAHSDFALDYNAYEGTAFGLAHTLFQTAFFRPANFSRKVKNLYFAGQYTNPGVGVPIALISSQIVRNLIKKDHE